VYVDNSVVAKTKAADSLSMTADQYFPKKVRSNASSSGLSSGGDANVYNINITLGANSTCSHLNLFDVKSDA